MNFGTFTGFVLTLLFGIITTYFIVTTNLDKTITNKIKDPEFVKTIIEEVRIPFLIFDENNNYVVDGGAAKLIKEIVISKDGRDITNISLTMKNKMNIAPILTSLSGSDQFFPATPKEESGWEYRALKYTMVWADTTAEAPPAKLFKLDILDL